MRAPDLIDAVLAAADRTPDAVATVAVDGVEQTYGALAAAVRRGAAALRRSGLRPDDGVLFAVRPSPTAVVTALAAVAAGGVVTIMDPGAGSALAPARLALVRPRWSMAEPVVHAATTWPLRTALAHRGLALPDLRHRGVRHVLVGGHRWWPGVPRSARTWERLQHGVDAPPLPPADPDALALVVFTSGTTAQPRAVTHTRGTLSAGMAAVQERLGLRATDTLHTDQLMIGLPALAAGATWSFAPTGYDGATYARTARERRATVAYAVPTVLVDAAEHGLPDQTRLIATGGAPVTPAVVRIVQARSPRARVVAIYGMTEALPVATTDGVDLLAHADGGGEGLLLGHPVAGTQVRVDDDGMLHVRGPQTTPGYLGSEPMTEVATGDLGSVLPDGRLVLLGRAKDMLLRGTTNIYPALIEPLVEEIDGVAGAAVVGLADERTADERMVLVIAPREGAPSDLAERVRRALPGRLDADRLPDHILVVDALPRSGRGSKVDKPALRALARTTLTP